MREIARGLRPQALDDFGLRSALVSLAAQATDRSGVRIRAQIPPDLPALAEEEELAIYRVAQESLTNVVRHANAGSAELRLGPDGAGGVELVVSDDGRGITPHEASNGGSGLAGMRERALLIGADLDCSPSAGGGTCVRLRLGSPA
jgi:two-component system sensor histidine kinase UhpB